MRDSILKFLSSETEEYPLEDMKLELENSNDVFLHEVATEFERAMEKAKKLNDKNFPMLTAANALSVFIANTIAYKEEKDPEKQKTYLMNCLDSTRQLWNIARHINKK